MAAAIAFAAPASAQMYGFGTGKQGSFTYSAGAAIAKIAVRQRLESAPAARLAARAPLCRASMPASIEFGLANELETHYAVTGTVIYKGKPQPDLRVVAILTPLYSRDSSSARISPIKTLADLKGKRVATDYASQRVLHVLTQGHARQWRLDL